RPALLRGQLVVVTRQDHQARGVIDVEARFDAVEQRLASSPAIHVTVAPDLRYDEVLRALDEAHARVAVVARVAVATGKQEVLGVITHRQIATVACATAKLTG